MKFTIKRDYGKGISLEFEMDIESLFVERVVEDLNKAVNVFTLFEKEHLPTMAAVSPVSDADKEVTLKVVKVVYSIDQNGNAGYRVFTPEGTIAAKYGAPVYADTFKSPEAIEKIAAWMKANNTFIWTPTQSTGIVLAIKDNKLQRAVKFVPLAEDTPKPADGANIPF